MQNALHTIGSKPNDPQIWFQTKGVAAEISGQGPYRAELQGFHSVEALLPEKNEPESKNKKYFVRIFRDIKTKDDYQNALNEFAPLKNTIEQIWHYVFGLTYRGDEHEFQSSIKPQWKDNRHVAYAAIAPNEMLPGDSLI